MSRNATGESRDPQPTAHRAVRVILSSRGSDHLQKVNFFCLKQRQFAASHSGPNIFAPGRVRAAGLAQDMVVGINVG